MSAARIIAIIRLLRPQHWIKNTLIFLPLFLAHEWRNTEKLMAAMWAFVAFSLTASAIYVINDMLDVEADRSHTKKSRRPFAAGDLPLLWGVPITLVLIVAAFAFCQGLPAQVWQLFALYLVTTTAYSIWFKSQAIIDVIVLASLYTLRLLIGGAATDVEVSPWLMAMSLFLFTSLAFVKRFVEVSELAGTNESLTHRRRSYVAEDLPSLQIMGTIAGYLSVLVMALYITSEKMTELYDNGWALWGTCPILLYWISRVWLLARRGELNEDPVVFAVTDPVSIGSVLLVGAIVVFASGGKTVSSRRTLDGQSSVSPVEPLHDQVVVQSLTCTGERTWGRA